MRVEHVSDRHCLTNKKGLSDLLKIIATICALMMVVTTGLSAESYNFSNRVLRGHDLSADGGMLVVALSDDGAGVNPQVLLSDNGSFESFRTLDLPIGYVWMHPVFSPDASHIAISGYCVDFSLCPDGDISNIYEVNLSNNDIQRVSPPQPDFFQFEPYYADNGQIYYLFTENVGSYTKSRSYGGSLIVTIFESGERRIVFPTDSEIYTRDGRSFLFPPEIYFPIDRILEVRADQLAFLSGARSQFNLLDESRLRARARSTDPRIRALHREVLIESQRVRSNSRWNSHLNDRIYVVTEESAEFLTDDRVDQNAIQHRTVDAAEQLGPGRFLVARSPFSEGEKFFIYEDGVTTFLMDMPDGIQIVWGLAASEDASVIAYTRGAWFNLTESRDVQPLEHRDALVILRQGQPVQYLD